MQGPRRLCRTRDWGGSELWGQGSRGRGWAPLGPPWLGSAWGPAFAPGCCQGCSKPAIKGTGRQDKTHLRVDLASVIR